MTVDCTQCHVSLAVPSYSELKRLGGDHDPYLDVLKKIGKALEERTPPFQGICHQCQERLASLQIPITFRLLVKREVSEHEGIQPGMTSSGPGLTLVVGAAQEQWRTVRFPLLFCRECHRDFTRRWRRATLLGFVRNSALFLFLAPVLLVLLVLVFFLPFISVLGVILVIVMAVRHRTRKVVDPFLLAAVQKLPLIGEAISEEDEYRLSADASREWGAGKPSCWMLLPPGEASPLLPTCGRGRRTKTWLSYVDSVLIRRDADTKVFAGEESG